MKLCTRCNKVKDESLFSQRQNGEPSTRCKVCFNAYQRTHYKRNKAAYALKAKANRDRIKVHLIALKTGVACLDCEIVYPYYIFDFDHVRGKKTFNISEAGSRGVSMSRLREELDKCDLVCANCHRERTQSRSNLRLAKHLSG